MLCGCSAYALPSGGFVSPLVLASLTACDAQGVAQPKLLCLPSSFLPALALQKPLAGCFGKLKRAEN